jgi:hypothetical protein
MADTLQAGSAMSLIPGYVRAKIAQRDPTMREDLLLIPVAEAAGWRVSFERQSWHFSAVFEKGPWTVWLTRMGWTVGRRTLGGYVIDRRCDALAAALGVGTEA